MNIVIREATLKDADFLLQLRNFSGNRVYFGNTEAVDSEAHKVWLQKTLQDSHSIFFIAMFDGFPVGQFRVNSSGEVSVSIVDQVKGRGAGSSLIKIASAAAICFYPNGLTAFVKSENLRSQRSFTSAGYIYDCDLQRDGEEYKKYLYSKDAS